MSAAGPCVQVQNFAVKRRRWLMAVLGGAAALGGAHLAWRNYQAPGKPASDRLDLWQRQFESVDGGMFHLAPWRGRPLLLNFWATWCPPCIEELPLLSNFYQENVTKGWLVLGLAVDQLVPVKQFLARTPVTFPVVLAGVNGIELGRSLGNLTDGLPFTAVIGTDGEVVQSKIGRMQAGDLRALTRMK